MPKPAITTTAFDQAVASGTRPAGPLPAMPLGRLHPPASPLHAAITGQKGRPNLGTGTGNLADGVSGNEGKAGALTVGVLDARCGPRRAKSILDVRAEPIGPATMA